MYYISTWNGNRFIVGSDKDLALVPETSFKEAINEYYEGVWTFNSDHYFKIEGTNLVRYDDSIPTIEGTIIATFDELPTYKQLLKSNPELFI